MRLRTLLLIASLGLVCQANAQSVIFNFDGGPVNTGTPVDQVSDGITAHFSHTGGSGYAIWSANVYGFTPVGFAGYSLWPAGVFGSDLHIDFSTPLTDISMLYAPQELATDSSCTMRITGYLGANFVATNTYQNPNPGTWPTDTLSLASASYFDRVVVHYESPPPTGGDYGAIFAIDNIVVTPVPEPASWAALGVGLSSLIGLRRLRRR